MNLVRQIRHGYLQVVVYGGLTITELNLLFFLNRKIFIDIESRIIECNRQHKQNKRNNDGFVIDEIGKDNLNDFMDDNVQQRVVFISYIDQFQNLRSPNGCQGQNRVFDFVNQHIVYGSGHGLWLSFFV